MRAKWLLSMALLFSVCSQAEDWSSLYGTMALEREKPRLQLVAEDVAANDIGPYLSNPQRLLFGALPIDLTLGTHSASPIEDHLYNAGSIVLPALTLLFVEDLSKAYAWLWAHQFSSETVDEYTSMLRYRKATDFPDSKYPEPLTALHVPANALDDVAVKKMFLRVRTSAYTFLILQQMGRLRGSGETSEEQIDLFTLDLMKRNSETPLGLLLLMNAGVSLPDDERPVTSKRLLEMATYLDSRVQDFVEGRPDRQLARNAIHAIARSLRVSAASLENPGFRSAQVERARRTDVSTLAPKSQYQAKTPNLANIPKN